jgi:hypothetical protein
MTRVIKRGRQHRESMTASIDRDARDRTLPSHAVRSMPAFINRGSGIVNVSDVAPCVADPSIRLP